MHSRKNVPLMVRVSDEDRARWQGALVVDETLSDFVRTACDQLVARRTGDSYQRTSEALRRVRELADEHADTIERAIDELAERVGMSHVDG